MIDYEHVRTLHLEITDRCNANCPMCPRSIHGAYVNPNLKLKDLSLLDIQRIFPLEFIKQLRMLYLCGNYGDPIVAKETLEILQYFKTVNPDINLAVFTNASARDLNWWKTLGGLLSTQGSYVRFSIDGLQDTNHLYRQNTNWDRIMANAQAFIDSGGIAFWDYLAFEHNHHQIEEAKALARQMGFKEFYTKYSSRFVRDSGTQALESFPVYNKEGHFERYLRPIPDNYLELAIQPSPTFPERISPQEPQPLAPWIPRFQDSEMQASYLQDCVSCKAQNEQEVYVSAEGFLLPCCWTAFTIRTTLDAEHIRQMRGLIFNQGLDRFSLFSHTPREIIESPFFQKVLTHGWQQRSPQEGQILLCQKFCGSRSFVRKEFENTERLYTPTSD